MKTHHHHHHGGGQHGHRHHRRWSGIFPTTPWWAYGNDDDDSSDGDDDQEITPATATATSGCLEDRCTSDYVGWVQQSLNHLGGKLQVTQQLDRPTINAINLFKQRHGVPAREYYASPLLEQALVKAGAASPPTVRRLPCGPTAVKDVLLPLLNRFHGDIPVEYLLGWITVESGGKLGDLTKICERGYFQVHPEESQDLKLDHDRLSTDAGYSVAGGIKLVRMYMAGVERLAQQYGLSKNSDLFWGLVKLRHWIPSAPARILLRMSKDGAPLTDWNSVRQYVQGHADLGFGGFDPRAGVKSVDNYLGAAARWRKWLGQKN